MEDLTLLWSNIETDYLELTNVSEKWRSSHYAIYLPLNSLDISINQVEDISRQPQVERELVLMKLNADSSTRAEVMTCTKFLIVFW